MNCNVIPVTSYIIPGLTGDLTTTTLKQMPGQAGHDGKKAGHDGKRPGMTEKGRA